MRVFNLQVKVPTDAMLDKVRIYIGTSPVSETLFAAGNKVYEGPLANYKFSGYTPGTIYYAGFEYFNAAGKILRPISPTRFCPYNDIGPWNAILGDPFAFGDANLGMLSVTDVLQEERLMNYHISQLLTKTMTAANYSPGNAFSTNVTGDMAVLCDNGVLRALPGLSFTHTSVTPTTFVIAFHNALYSVPEPARTINVGGYLWRLDFMYLENYECFKEVWAHTFNRQDNTQHLFLNKKVSRFPASSNPMLSSVSSVIVQAGNLCTIKNADKALGSPPVWRPGRFNALADFSDLNLDHWVAAVASTAAMVTPICLTYIGQAA